MEEKSPGERISVETSQGDFACENLVIATGGLSFAKVGASDFGYRIAKQFGVKIVETRPSLVPLEFEKSINERFKRLAGISLDVMAGTQGKSFRENILFTHSGMSGPAILQASNYWKKEKALEFDLLPDRDAEKLLSENRHRKILVSNFLDEFFPERFAETFASSELKNIPLNQLNEKQINEFASKLNSWKVYFAKTAGYDRAEVTLGGISTDELSSQTMESKRVKGLYFVGEVVDVTGWLGGYNFQWAWSSGFVCGQAV
jgi:predicted Rossmann fold flavoprotein